MTDVLGKGKPVPKFWAIGKAFPAWKRDWQVSASCLKALYLAALASATVSAVMLTMRRTVALAVRM